MKGFRFPCLVALSLAFAAHASVPTIDPSQPADVTVNVASVADFSIVATNAASYQWQTNGVNALNATNATFALDDVSSCTVDVIITSPDGGSITSRVAQLNAIPGTVVNLTISGYMPNNQSNTLVIQLFDHDKPATVQNFIHYIVSGAYTNMFFDRMVPNFVLQGGDYGVDDPTDTNTPVLNGSSQIYSIDSSFVQNFAVTPNLCFWVDNEFSDGPIIHNRFGTIAMAKKSGDPDSAENAFFLNLGDNSTNLDLQNGGFTVFGRVISGSNSLAYFNTLAKPASGIFDESTIDDGPIFTDLPVNFSGYQVPVNTNLVYAFFSLPSGYPTDTNAPIAVETNMIIDTNNGDVQYSGTASDDVALARVWGSVSQTQNAITVGPVNASNRTNWSVDFGELPAGSNYFFTVSCQDGAGNLTSTNYTFNVPAFPLRVVANGHGTFTPANAALTNLSYLREVALKAKPSAGSIFVGWTIGTNQGSLNPDFTVVNTNGGVVVANFITNDLGGGLHFTYPTAAAKLTNAHPVVTGALAKTATTPAQVTMRLFSRTTKALLYSTTTTNFTNNTWSLQMPEIAPGLYTAQAVATSAAGKGAVAYQNFDVLGAVAILVRGPGKTTLKTGTNFVEIGKILSLTAIPSAGASFHDWVGSFERVGPSVSFELSAANSVENPVTLQATFYSNDLPKNALTVLSPKTGGTLFSSPAIITGTLSNLTRVTCQAFTNNVNLEPATDVIEAKINGTNWTASLPGLGGGSQKLIVVGYDSQGRTRMIEQNFSVNLFGTVAGTYSGIFSSSYSTTDSGMFTITMTSNGVASGRIQFPGVPLVYPIHVKFPLSGVVVFSPGYFSAESIVVEFKLFTEANVIQGEIAHGAWTTTIFGYRQASGLASSNSPPPGSYVVLLTPVNTNTSLPIAPGYAIMTAAPNATFQVAGLLPDDSSFSEASIMGPYGYWPLFSIPSGYGQGGFVIGWQDFETNVVIGATAAWVKGATRSAYYPKAFSAPQQLSTSGGSFEAPTNGQYNFVFTSVTQTNALTNTLTCASGQFQPASPITAISLNTNGVLTGQYTDPSGNSDSFFGAFANSTIGGAGFILQTNQTTAKFLLTPSP